MSFIDAARLAGAGANQIVAGHSAPGQNVNDGILALTADAAPVSAPKTAAPRAPAMVPEKARYELLRNICRTRPKSELGRQADILLRRQRLFVRTRLSRAAMRYQNAAVTAFVASAMKQPQAIAAADPQHRLRNALAPRRHAARYDILRHAGQLATKPSVKTISLKQFPQLQRILTARSLAHVAVAMVGPQAALAKSVIGIAGALRPPGANNGANNRKRLLAYALA